MKRKKHIRTKKERFLPFAYQKFGLECSVNNCSIDRIRLEIQPDAQRRVVNIEFDDWRTITLGFNINASLELLSAVLPPTEVTSAPASLIMVLRCPTTRLRRSYPVATAPLNPGTYVHHLVLQRDEVAGRVELIPYLVRSCQIEPQVAGFASAKGTRLASARAWEIRLERERVPEGKFLDVRFRSFREDDVLSAFGQNLYRLECDQEQPVLWINSDHDRIAKIFSVRGTTGRRVRIRDLFGDIVAYGVWNQLFMRAAVHLLDQKELVYDWEESVLREVLPYLFPEKSDKTERMRALQQLVSYADWSSLIERLDAALQNKCEISQHMNKLIDEVAQRQPEQQPELR